MSHWIAVPCIAFSMVIAKSAVLLLCPPGRCFSPYSPHKTAPFAFPVVFFLILSSRYQTNLRPVLSC
ncbi:hypothetical protein AX774_g6428 [Zancudomyces culisetae]|uniref:Secreted peptide n=1 Tax=Zancudomyces culisetae TaxID=1213189 RepID=A0A1R1PGS1_ZANCU|nr:hypothetical protein AX774_g6428 [Zancudomyces culisetae]|eukprot:OMH80137.1 hypothetical protein AX774_g6428 [Zancudomyces culisetae]